MDVLFLGIGTIDGRHAVSAGTRGFKFPPNSDTQTRGLYETRLHQQPYNRHMATS